MARRLGAVPISAQQAAQVAWTSPNRGCHAGGRLPKLAG
jgi:hypothetical protein